MADIIKLFKDHSKKWHWYHSVRLRPLVSIVDIVEKKEDAESLYGEDIVDTIVAINERSRA